MVMLTSFALAVQLLAGLDAATRRTDGHRIQGEWLVATVIEDGREAPLDREANVRVRITGNTLHIADGDSTASARFELDATRNPRRLAAVPLAGPHKGRSLNGIFQLEAERLLICLPQRPDQDTPNDFSSRLGSGRLLLTLRREPRDVPPTKP